MLLPACQPVVGKAIVFMREMLLNNGTIVKKVCPSRNQLWCLHVRPVTKGNRKHRAKLKTNKQPSKRSARWTAAKFIDSYDNKRTWPKGSRYRDSGTKRKMIATSTQWKHPNMKGPITTLAESFIPFQFYYPFCCI